MIGRSPSNSESSISLLSAGWEKIASLLCGADDIFVTAAQLCDYRYGLGRCEGTRLKEFNYD